MLAGRRADYHVEKRSANEELEKRVAARTAELEAEVAQRRRAEEIIRASEQRWRSMFEASAVGIALTDENRRFAAANRARRERRNDRGRAARHTLCVQVSLIGIHFSPSIASSLPPSGCVFGDGRNMTIGGPKQNSAKLLSVGLLRICPEIIESTIERVKFLQMQKEDRIARDDGVGGDGFGCEGVPAAHPETEEIAGQQEIDGLSPPVGAEGVPPCRARGDAVPSTRWDLAVGRSPRPADTGTREQALPVLAVSIEGSRRARASIPAL
jgi:hypothetical protein